MDNKARVLPHSAEAEQSLLGAIMLDNARFEDVSEFLRSEHFYTPIHGKIYEAIVKLIDGGSHADPITLRAYFENENDLATIGGGSYLVQLVDAVISIAAAEDHAKLIYEHYLRRQLIIIGEDMSHDADKFDLSKDAKGLIETSEGKLYQLSESSQRGGGFVSMSEICPEAVQSMEHALKSGKSITGITSGFLDIDSTLSGFNKTDLIILAGRPSMGKTALATNMAFNAAREYTKKADGGGKVAFFSLEMSSQQLMIRILAQESGVSSSRAKMGKMKEEDFSKIIEASQRISSFPMYIDDTPALSISNIRTRARRLKRIHDIDLIVIDYLQLIQGSAGKKNENRVQEISEITRSLKAIAKELDVPIIALSQLSRAVEMRDDKRPQLSDLRESGSIEQDADIVMFVYREAYYEERKEPAPGSDNYKEWQDKMREIHNISEIIIAKHRQGSIGTIKLRFDANLTKFSNLSQRRDN